MLNDDNMKNKDTNDAQPKNENVNKDETAENIEVSETEVKEKTVSEKEKKVSFTKKRSFKYGSMATAFTAIFIAIVILLNVGITVLAQKFPISVDLTKDKNFGVSQTTIDYVKKVSNPIKITLFGTKQQYAGNSYLVDAQKIIEQFPKYNSKISIDYVDYDKNPTVVAAYPDENISQYDVVVSSTVDGKEKYKHIAIDDLFITQTNSSTYKQEILGNKAEQQMDNAIDYVTATKLPKVVFTQGHNEVSSSDFQSLLKNGNFNVSTIALSSTDISADTDTIAIVAPQADFSDQEIAKLDTFMKNGGNYGKNVYVFLDPRLKSLPKLESYLEEWGVKAETGVIYDYTNNFNNTIYNVMADTVDTTVLGKNISTDIKTDVTDARPLTTIFDTKGDRKVTKVITTGSSSKLLSNLTAKPASSDKSGPFTTMTLTTMGSGEKVSNMVVSGSYDMILAEQTSASNKNNAKVLLGLSNKLMEKESGVTIDNKYSDTSTLSLTTVQRSAITVIFMVLIPLALLIFGLVTFLRRRHL